MPLHHQELELKRGMFDEHSCLRILTITMSCASFPTGDSTALPPADVESSLVTPLLLDWTKFKGSVSPSKSSYDKNVWTHPEYSNFRLKGRNFHTDGSLVRRMVPLSHS